MEDQGKLNATELRQLKQTNLFTYTKYDGFSDWLLYRDEAIQRGSGVFQVGFGTLGVTSGVAALATLNPLSVLLGTGVATISAGAVLEGAKHTLGSYLSDRKSM